MQNSDQALSLLAGGVPHRLWEVIKGRMYLSNPGHWKGYCDGKGVYYPPEDPLSCGPGSAAFA